MRAIAQAEGIELTDDHWTVVALRERFQEDGHTPNFRNMLKDFEASHPGVDWKTSSLVFRTSQPGRILASQA